MTYLKLKMKLTLIGLNGLAMTSKEEIEVVEIENEKVIIKMRGKRKLYSLKLTNEHLVFDGWDLSILKVDTETNVMRGNACYNFITTKHRELKEFIEGKNLNESFNKKGQILWIHPEHNGAEEVENVLYPEIETEHAVIRRIKKSIV